MDEVSSLQQKTSFLKNKLAQHKDIIADIHAVSGNQRLGYRNKVCLHATYADGRWHFGLMSRKVFVPLPLCPVHAPIVNTTAAFLAGVMPPPDIFPLHFYVQSGKQLMLVVKSRTLPLTDWLSPEVEGFLQTQGIEGLWLHLNPSAGHKVFMKNNFFLLSGKPHSLDAHGLRYGPMSFQQLIPALYDDSVAKAMDFLKPDKNSVVVDLYCGTGYTCLQWHSRGAVTTGVELNGEAVGCFKVNVPGVEVLRGKCADRIPQLEVFTHQHKGFTPLLYVNPPRTGIEEKVLRWITESYRPLRIAYLSCSPGTLSRDLTLLEAGGYNTEGIIPYDFFPQTIHVECLALLSLF